MQPSQAQKHHAELPFLELQSIRRQDNGITYRKSEQGSITCSSKTCQLKRKKPSLGNEKKISKSRTSEEKSELSRRNEPQTTTDVEPNISTASRDEKEGILGCCSGETEQRDHTYVSIRPGGGKTAFKDRPIAKWGVDLFWEILGACYGS